MVTKVISELKSVSSLKILPETGPWSRVAPSRTSLPSTTSKTWDTPCSHSGGPGRGNVGGEI